MIWTFISTKKITRSQKTNLGFKKQIHLFSVIAHIDNEKSSMLYQKLNFFFCISIQNIFQSAFLIAL
jgi:hypothetical protein